MCKTTTVKKFDEACEIAEWINKEAKIIFDEINLKDKDHDGQANQRTPRRIRIQDGNIIRSSERNQSGSKK